LQLLKWFLPFLADGLAVYVEPIWDRLSVCPSVTFVCPG